MSPLRTTLIKPEYMSLCLSTVTQVNHNQMARRKVLSAPLRIKFEHLKLLLSKGSRSTYPIHTL